MTYNQVKGEISDPGPIAIIVIIGAITVMAQTVILRDFLSLCQGSEIVLGLGLAAWLGGGALGSVLSRRIQENIQSRVALEWGFLCLAIILPASLFAIRNFRYLTGGLPGQTLSLGGVAVLSVLSLAPLGSLSSAQYCFAVGWWEGFRPRKAAAVAYGLEALGFMLGGLMFTFVLSGRMAAMAVMLLCVGLSFLGIFLLTPKTGRRITGIVMSVAILALAFLWGPRAELMTQRMAYPGCEIRSVSSSPYGQMVLAQRQGQINLYYNGASLMEHPLTVSPGCEEMVALGLLSAEHREDVLCIGGWDLLPVILKQRVRSVTIAEPDPWLLANIRRQGLASWDSILFHSQLTAAMADGRVVIKERKRYDLILSGLPYPYNLEWNRYYTLEFFVAARRCLNDGGVFLLRLPGGEAALDGNKIDLAATISRAMAAAFPRHRLMMGLSIYLIGSGAGDVNDSLLLERYDSLDLAMSFFSRGNLEQLLDAGRRNYLSAEINRSRAGINSDLRPRALVPGLGLWQAAIFGGWSKAYRLAVFLSPLLWLAVMLLLLWPRMRQPGAAFTTGAAAMGLQMLCLWGLQIEMGTLYHWLGLGNALFMAGTALGSLYYAKRRQGLKVINLESAWLIWISAFCLLSLVRILSGWGYLLGSAISGLLLGLEYPALVDSYAREGRRTQGLSAAPIYAADLAGGLLAAILVGILLVPAWGLAGAAAFLLGFKAVSIRWWLLP